MTSSIRNENEFNITFDTEISQIDVDTLVTTLTNLNFIIQELNLVSTSSQEVELKIKPFEKGSFDILFMIDPSILTQVVSLFTKDNIEIAKNLIEAFKAILELKKFLKGEKAKSIQSNKSNQYTIENNYGNIIVVDKIVGDLYFHNPDINKRIEDTFDILKDNSNIKGFFVKNNKNEKIFEAKESDLEIMAAKNQMLDAELQPTRTKSFENIKLSIYKIVFRNGANWWFHYNKELIKAKLEDIEFLEKVERGEISFANKDILLVTMDVIQTHDPEMDTFKNSEYLIKKVHRVIHQNDSNNGQLGL